MLRTVLHRLAMDEDAEFKKALSRFAADQPTMVQAAAKLSITRQDLYRYIKGETVPRRKRRRQMMQMLRRRPEGIAMPITASHLPILDKKSVTNLRDVLLHLVRLIDLDEASRQGE